MFFLQTPSQTLSVTSEGSMSYIALSRIKAISQLYLLNGLYEEKIYTSQKALKALKYLEDRAINADSIGKRNDQIKIACLNVQNLRHHFEDVSHDHTLRAQNLFFLCETWLSNTQNDTMDNYYHLDNYSSKFCSAGYGKGLAAYSDPIFAFQGQHRGSHYQMMKYSTPFMHSLGKIVNLEIVGLFRSSGNMKDDELLSDLTSMINKDKICIILGDFNLRYTKDNQHIIIQYLKNNNFCQQVDHLTHKRGGKIDFFFIRKANAFQDVVITYELYGAFYSDHFGLCIKINKGRDGFKKMESSLTSDILRSLADSTNNHGIKSNKESSKKQANNKRKTYSAKAPTQSTNKKSKI